MHVLSQARLGLCASFWAKTTSLLLWQGSWKLLELVRYHIVSNTEVSMAALLTRGCKNIFKPLTTLKAEVFQEQPLLSAAQQGCKGQLCLCLFYW